MTLDKKLIKLEGLVSTLNSIMSATPYAFAYIKRQWELSRILDNFTLAHSTTIHGCK